MTLGASSPYAQDNSEEYLYKATYIYNFTKFVEWPGERALGKRSSIDICVIGDSDLLQTGAVFQKGSTSKLALSLVQEKNPANAAGHCHIVFIGKSEELKVRSLLDYFKSKSVLTVSDIDDFADRGGMIGMVMIDDKPKLIISPKNAAAAGLRIDAQLLEVAYKVLDR